MSIPSDFNDRLPRKISDVRQKDRHRESTRLPIRAIRESLRYGLLSSESAVIEIPDSATKARSLFADQITALLTKSTRIAVLNEGLFLSILDHSFASSFTSDGGAGLTKLIHPQSDENSLENGRRVAFHDIEVSELMNSFNCAATLQGYLRRLSTR
jgi:hypothetical protein